MADTYLDLIVTYSVYAKQIWHDADVGGYWGDGIDAKNDNGAVRGMCGTMLGYAMLVHARDNGWLTRDKLRELDDAGLDRAELLRCIRANLAHICAHHKSAPTPLKPVWGLSWQSSLWLGAAGPAAILVSKDLDPNLKSQISELAAMEADRIAYKPPKDYRKGDTGAEENGWDTHAPAVALALMPDHPHAADWWRGLCVYAVNTASVKADQTSDEMIGAHRRRDTVTTANLFDDFTLDNHGFFHPAYLVVLSQELGEAWLILQMGDQMNGTQLARDFEPYAMNHVKEMWENVMRPLLLSDGQFAFPNSNDWTFNTSQKMGTLAFIATSLKDPVAMVAEQRHMNNALNHRAVSPPGRIYGDANMEWFWEPIMSKRASTSLLQHAYRASPTVTRADEEALERMTDTRTFPDSKVWLHRNPDYFVSVAWGARKMGTFQPNVAQHLQRPYLTLPIDGILPKEVESLEAESTAGEARVLTLRLKDGQRCALVALPHSVVWISPVPLRPLSIQNDKLSGGRRTLHTASGSREVPAFSGETPIDLDGWVNIDDRLGLITAGNGFRYKPANGYNQRSVAMESIVPRATWGAWQMIPNCDQRATEQAAKTFSAKLESDSVAAEVLDGIAGRRYRIRMSVSGVSPVEVDAIP